MLISWSWSFTLPSSEHKSDSHLVDDIIICWTQVYYIKFLEINWKFVLFDYIAIIYQILSNTTIYMQLL